MSDGPLVALAWRIGRMERLQFRSVTRLREPRVARGMVRERVAIVRKCFEAWTTDRFESVAPHLDPAVEVNWCESRAPYRGIYAGHAGWRQLFGQIRSRFAEVWSEPRDFVVAGQHVAVPHTVRMRGRDGIEVAATSTVVFTFLGVRVVALRLYEREADAYAAIRAAVA
jgi:ketosteroid isomerase-like protein